MCVQEEIWENLVLMICVQIALAETQVLDRLRYMWWISYDVICLGITKQMYTKLTVHLGQYKQGFYEISG